ncbi:hypothetical protein ABG79_00495 [Caloramator mitchellensis]|uniref:Uncharacterized protein n=1 Tax=Caloramator mitchellensis TaxID=908809 RepID=A0A0R3K2C8_CALMK|nr:hypothetical protein [Caloramator mitchellensis]KRQ87694.1 hypothetical protein ABG79_00495 [Caloramator mitchellensis]
MVFLGIGLFIIIIIAYYYINKEYAKKLTLEFMFYVEKKAEELAINEGKQKFEWVVSQYDKLPVFIKLIISKDKFREIIQQLFDEAVSKMSSN